MNTIEGSAILENYTKIIFNNTVFPGFVNYTYLCEQRYNIGVLSPVQKALEVVFPEYEKDENNISGLDLMAKLDEATYRSLLECNKILKYPLQGGVYYKSIYAYVKDDGHPSSKPYYARWKDTAFVEPFKALRYRIRWTKSEFTEKDAKDGTYFNVPNDQLREFPGYVYHCHILRHEDDEMMRPIMMQLPQNANLGKDTPCNYNLSSSAPNLRWKDKYQCINNRCKGERTKRGST